MFLLHIWPHVLTAVKCDILLKENREEWKQSNFPQHSKQPYVYLKIASIFYNNTTHSEDLGDVTCKLQPIVENEPLPV